MEIELGDIRRMTEVFICRKLTESLIDLDHKFLPMTGFGMNEEELEPPFTVVAMTTAEKTHDQAGIWLLAGTVQTISHARDHTTEEHEVKLRRIFGVLTTIPAYSDSHFQLHGLSITSQRSAEHSESQSYADIIDITCGASSHAA